MDWNSAHRQLDGLELNELPDGYVVYQRPADRVHYLNRTAAVVFELCDGTTTAAEISGVLKSLYDLPEAPTAEVEQCLERFLGEGLIRQV